MRTQLITPQPQLAQSASGVMGWEWQGTTYDEIEDLLAVAPDGVSGIEMIAGTWYWVS